MDRLTSGFDGLHLSRKEGEWKTVGSCSKQSLESLPSQKMGPLIISQTCPFVIYQLPKFHTEESILRLVTSVAHTGPETNRLFSQVTQETYPKQLVILRGVPGSGKSFLASALMATTRKGTICSADDYFTDSKGNYDFNPGRLRDAHEDCESKCRKLMERETSPLIIDNCNTRRFEMEPYVRMAIENNYAITVFELETSWKNDARTLTQKNIHRVPRGKIQDMMDRFEQISPFLVVDDVRKKLGDVGNRYNPVRADASNQLPGLPFPAGRASPPLMGASKLETHIPSLMPLNLKEEYPSSRNMATPSPPPLMSEYVMNSLGSPPRLGGKKKRKAKAAAVSVGGGGARMIDNSPESPPAIGATARSPIPSKPYSESLLESAKMLQAFFPTTKVEDLADLLEKHDGDVNEAMNALLDSGYSIAEVVLEETASCPPSPANSTTETIRAEDNTSQSPGEDDWFNVKLTHEFVKRLAEMFGQPDDPNIQTMLADPDGFNTRLPPELGFKIYRKLARNAAAKARKEAEEAAKD